MTEIDALLLRRYAARLTPYHEMVVTRDDFVRLKAQSANDLRLVQLCNRALDGDAEATGRCGQIIRDQWRADEIADIAAD